LPRSYKIWEVILNAEDGMGNPEMNHKIETEIMAQNSRLQALICNTVVHWNQALELIM
jgi:hypothetical protein